MVLLNQSYRDIDLIDPNPWQMRQPEEDQKEIEELAQSILKDGLSQVPSGRNTEGDRAQLAFGHRRLAACRLLVALGHDEYRNFPINIHPFSDEQMAITAYSENEKRKNLNPVERARAIEKMIADFGWNQQEVAERLQIDRSSISNSLRLLRLPAPVLIAVAMDIIPVRSAMALLPYYELTPLELSSLEEHFADCADFIALARSGMVNSDTIRKTVDTYLDYVRPIAPVTQEQRTELPLFTSTGEPPAQEADVTLAGFDPGGEDQTVFAEIDRESGTITPVDDPGPESEPSIRVDESEPAGEAYEKMIDSTFDQSGYLRRDQSADEQKKPEKASAETSADPKPAPAPEPAPESLVETLVFVWNIGGDVTISYRKAGERLPVFLTRSVLTAADFPEILAELGLA